MLPHLSAEAPSVIVAAAARSALAELNVMAAELGTRVTTAESEVSGASVVGAKERREAVTAHLENFLLHLTGQAPLDLEALRALGRRRADQGVPLTALLNAVRLGIQYVWEELTRRIPRENTEGTNALLAEATRFWATLSTMSDEMRAGYVDSLSARVRDSQTERNELLDILLGLPDVGRQARAAQNLGLPRYGRFQIAVVEHGRTPLSARMALADPHAVRVLWRLDHTVSVCLADVGTAQRVRGLQDILRPEPGWRIGVSRGFRDVVDAPAARRQALIALGTVPTTGTGVARYGEDPLATLVASAPDTAIEVTEDLLHSVLTLPEIERDTLLTTLDRWFAAGGSTAGAAGALFCHRNTVRYRLRRIEELTGLSVTDPRSSAQLLMGLHAHLRR
ncbi:PucR family transcriptional regulator [Streptomyces sp. NPDC055036]